MEANSQIAELLDSNPKRGIECGESLTTLRLGSRTPARPSGTSESARNEEWLVAWPHTLGVGICTRRTLHQMPCPTSR